MKKLLLILITLCITTIGYSQNFTVNNIMYSVTSATNNTVEITGYTNTTGGTVSVTIPATVTDASTNTLYSVTSIGPVAFINKQISSVVIPNSIISIGNAAFRINQLTNVTIPDSVISLGAGAFVSNSISNLDLGNTIETIDNSAFGGNALTALVIPDSVTSIGSAAFSNNQLTTITLGNGLTSIGTTAFSGNPINSVTSNSIVPPIITTGGSSDTFGNRTGIDLFIPNGTTGVYVTNAGALWTGFNSVTENAVLSTSSFELSNEVTVINTEEEIKIIYLSTIQLQSYSIYSMSGVAVATGKKSEIPTSYLATGIYILKLDFDKGIVTKKFVTNR